MNTKTSIQYTIKTPRLILKPIDIKDFKKVYSMSLEEGIQKFMPDQVYANEQEAKEVLDFLNSKISTNIDPSLGPIVLGIYTTQDLSLIGHIGLSPINNQVEIGYAIENIKQGQGFASEAIQYFTQWAFCKYSIKTILAIVDSNNQSSNKVLKKNNFFFDHMNESQKQVYQLQK